MEPEGAECYECNQKEDHIENLMIDIDDLKGDIAALNYQIKCLKDEAEYLSDNIR